MQKCARKTQSGGLELRIRPIGSGHELLALCRCGRDFDLAVVGQDRLQGRFGVARLEAPWASFAVVGDLAVDIDNAQAIRCAAVGLVDGVVDSVDQAGYGHLEPAVTCMGDLDTLSERLGLLEYNSVFNVLPGLPAVAGVGFANVDQQEFSFFPVRLVQGFQSPNYGPERVSRVARENQIYRPLSAE